MWKNEYNWDKLYNPFLQPDSSILLGITHLTTSGDGENAFSNEMYETLLC